MPADRIGRLLAAHEAEYAPLNIANKGDLRLLLTAAGKRNGTLAQAAGVNVELLLPKGPISAQHDPDAIDRVLDNLIANAVRHSPADSRVTLRCWREAQNAVLSVEDDGAGVPEVDRPYLFDKFSRGRTSSSEGKAGTGLGLFIVAMLIGRIGGQISYRPSTSGGSIFEVRLPTA